MAKKTTLIPMHLDLLGLSPETGLALVGDRIVEAKARHKSEIASLRSLEHSYRIKARWAAVKAAETDQPAKDTL